MMFTLSAGNNCILFYGLRPSTYFNRTNIMHMTTSVLQIKYIMYNVQDYSVLYNNAVRQALNVWVAFYSNMESTCITASFH
jgi:hypothetical protein